MRVVVLLLLAACRLTRVGLEASDDNGKGGGGMGAIGECGFDNECALAGVKCCDCPTFAVPVDDPAHRGCVGVVCPPMSCAENVQAECLGGECVLGCKPLACDLSCADGYAIDPMTGCLGCACAAPAVRECSGDNECARVRADCCGCARGGADTSVPASQVAQHDADLACPVNPACPDFDTCAPELSARCVQGQCELVQGVLPPNACGRPDLPACVSPEVCVVNANDAASMQGVGVCLGL